MPTIAELRKEYPHCEFYFFHNGWEMQKAPFYHARVKGVKKINENTLFIEM